MKIEKAVLEIPGAELYDENPLPMFRSSQHDQCFASDGSLSEAETEALGRHTGFRVLPYCMQDCFSLETRPCKYETIVMENEKLRAEFLPQLGGRLYSLFDKTKERELLFKNPVFKPANLAIRNAWFSGGIEWNVGHLGHAYHTCDDVFFAECKGASGERFLRMYDYVRTTGLFWQVDFHLPEQSEFLYAHIRICNDSNEAQPLYWWTNTAVREQGVRIFSGSRDLIYINPQSLQKEGDTHSYGHGQMPNLGFMPDKDISYPLNFEYASEYFFQNPGDMKAPWEAAAYPDGFVFLERSTQPLRIRKMFCWGTHEGGRNWQNRLSEPGKGDYVEIQAGLTPTQSHGADIQPNRVVEFTQVFGGCEGSGIDMFQNDWDTARREVENLADQVMPPEILKAKEVLYRTDTEQPCGEILYHGHGWAALESMRRKFAKEKPVPVSLKFPETDIGEKEKFWADILQGKEAEEISPVQLPSSWMTDKSWRPVLKEALSHEPEKAVLYIMLGVLEYENGNDTEATALWEKSMELLPTVIACRCLAVKWRNAGEQTLALAYMRRAFMLDKDCPSPCMVRELFDMLKENGLYDEIWDIYTKLPDKTGSDERILIYAAAAAVKLGKDEFLEDLFCHPFAVIREGENQLCDIWFEFQARRRKAAGDTRELAEIEGEVRSTLTPPRTIDYRLAQQ